MNRKFVLPLLLVLAACGDESPQSPPPDEPASDSATSAEATPAGLYDLALPDLDGDTLYLADYRGRHVLVNFWATWCAPCRAETPDLIELREKYGPRGFEVVGISMDVPVEGDDVVGAFVEEFDITYPIVMGDQHTTEAVGGMFGLPTTFLFGPDGDLIRRFTGLIPMSDLEPFLDALLPMP